MTHALSSNWLVLLTYPNWKLSLSFKSKVKHFFPYEFYPDAKINFNSMFYLNNTLWKCSITIFTFLYIEKIKESYWIMHKNIKVFLRHWGQFTLKKWGRLYYLSCLGWGFLRTTRISTLNGIFQSFFCLKSWEGKGCHIKSNKERRPKPI